MVPMVACHGQYNITEVELWERPESGDCHSHMYQMLHKFIGWLTHSGLSWLSKLLYMAPLSTKLCGNHVLAS